MEITRVHRPLVPIGHTPNPPRFVTLWRMKPLNRRVCLLWLVAVSAASGAWAGGAPGNLLVEWRVVSSARAQERQAGVEPGGIRLSTTDTQQGQEAVHSLLVLNGGRARLYVGRTVPQTNWQFLFSAPGASAHAGAASGAQSGQSSQAGAQLLSQTAWVDLGQGLTVHPRWAGGKAPVQVELEAQSRSAVGPMGGSIGIAPDGQTQRLDAASTLAIPLGQWVVVAQTRSQQTQSVRGTWSTTELDDQGGEQLEIRVRVP